MNPKSCELVDCEHVPLKQNCRMCGTILRQNGQAYKTLRYHCSHDDSSQRYLAVLRKQVNHEQRSKERFELSEPLFQLLQRIADKFEFSLETMALGLQLYNLLIQKPDRSYRDDSMEFVGACCLMVAAKAIELDKHIPYFSRFHKHAGRGHHSPQDFERQEKQIMEEFEWRLQKPTFMSFVHFYLSNGIYFSEDGEKCPIKIYRLEEKVKEHCYKVLKDGSFMLEDPEKLAANIVSDSRREMRLAGWNSILQEYSGIKATDLHVADILKPLNSHRHQNSSLAEHHVKLTLPKLDRIPVEKSSSRMKDRIQHVRGAMSLRSVPSYSTFSSLSVFGLGRKEV